MATIHKRKLRSGEIVWELTHGTGKDRQRFTAGRTKAEAMTVLKQFEEQIALHGQAPENLSVTGAMARYVEFLKGNRRSSTVRRYRRVLQTFERCFLTLYHPEIERLRDIKAAHVESYKQRRSNGEVTERESETDRIRDRELRERQRRLPKSSRKQNAVYGWLGRKRLRRVITPRTIKYELIVLSTFFGWTIRNNLATFNPVTNVERPRIPKRALPKFLTSEDLKRFFAACNERERRLFMTILLSGMRRGEVEFLTWDDISFELAVIMIQVKPDLEWQPKTDERIIPMSALLSQVLQEQYGERDSSRWVFPNHEGEHDTHILDKLKKICRRAGIRPSTVHALRHSFAAHLRMAGVSLADIADLLGHKDLATTQIYARVHQEHLRNAVAQLTPLLAARKDSPRTLPPLPVELEGGNLRPATDDDLVDT